MSVFNLGGGSIWNLLALIAWIVAIIGIFIANFFVKGKLTFLLVIAILFPFLPFILIQIAEFFGWLLDHLFNWLFNWLF